MSFSTRAGSSTGLALDIFGVFAPAHLRSRRVAQDLQSASVGSGVDLGLRSSHPSFSLGKATRVGMAGTGAGNQGIAAPSDAARFEFCGQLQAACFPQHFGSSIRVCVRASP